MIVKGLFDGIGKLRLYESYNNGEVGTGYQDLSNSNKPDLRFGDEIEYDTSTESVVSVNKGNEKDDCSKFDELKEMCPNDRINLGSGIYMKTLSIFAPIGFGQKCIIEGAKGSGKTELLKELAKGVVHNNDCEVFILEIGQLPNETADFVGLVGDKAKIMAFTFDGPKDDFSVERQEIKTAELVLTHCKRLVEQGKNVVLFLDSLNGLADAYGAIESIKSSTYRVSEPLGSEAITHVKELFATAGNYIGAGSLTVIATLRVKGAEEDEFMQTPRFDMTELIEEIRGVSNCKIVLDKRMKANGCFPPIDFLKCETSGKDLLLDGETIDFVNLIKR